MRQVILLCLFVLTVFNGLSQELKAVLEARVTLDADQFVGMDERKTLYFIEDNVLYKKSSQRTWFYNNPDLGALQSVNIQNPFKLILFYQNFNSVILLDNNLSELSQRLDFTRETLYNNVTFVSGSSQNNLWLYADDQKLHQYDYKNLSETVQTQAMTFYEADFEPLALASTYKHVWILSKKGMHQFDEYGVFIDSFHEEGITWVFPFKKGVIYLKGLQAFYLQDGKSESIALDYKGEVQTISVNNSYLCIFDGKVLHQYRLTS